MPWKLDGFSAHSPYVECCILVFDVETYIRALALRQIWQKKRKNLLTTRTWRKVSKYRVNSASSYVAQQESIKSFLLSSQRSFEAAREHNM